jgi:hypothetical protein
VCGSIIKYLAGIKKNKAAIARGKPQTGGGNSYFDPINQGSRLLSPYYYPLAHLVWVDLLVQVELLPDEPEHSVPCKYACTKTGS